MSQGERQTFGLTDLDIESILHEVGIGTVLCVDHLISIADAKESAAVVDFQ
ncbi:hypothetical protein D9M69_600810 [compost metagenome]